MYNEMARLDKIILPELKFMARHGLLEQEKQTPQEFKVTVTLWLDTFLAAESDALADTVNYAEVYAQISEVMLGEHHDLLESLAAAVAAAVLQNEPVQRVGVRLEKTAAPLAPGINLPVVLEIEREAADYGV